MIVSITTGCIHVYEYIKKKRNNNVWPNFQKLENKHVRVSYYLNVFCLSLVWKNYPCWYFYFLCRWVFTSIRQRPWQMTNLEFFVFILWGLVLVLVALNIVYNVYLKTTFIFMKFTHMIRFVFSMLFLRIRYFFSPKKKTPSISTTQPSLDTLTLSDLCNPAPLAQPTSQKQSCNPPKPSPKKRDIKGRYVRN